MADRDEIYRQIQLVCAGHPTEEVAHALGNSLAAVIGFGAATPEDAKKMIDEIAPEMLRTIFENWDYLKSMHGRIPHAGVSETPS